MSFAPIESGEGKPGGGIAGRSGSQRFTWRRSVAAPTDTSGEAGACGRGGVEAGQADSGFESSSLAAMRGMMEAVFYDTSWLSEDACGRFSTDKLAVHDGYTVRSFWGIRARYGEAGRALGEYIGCRRGDMGETG